MPKAVDKHPQSRSVGNSLYNPLRSGVASYEDPMSAIGDDMDAIGKEIGGVFSALGSIFGLPSPPEILAGIANGVGAIVAGATELITGFGGFFGRLIGGLLDGSQIPILDPTKILNLPGILKSWWNGWFNRTDGTGSEAEVTYVIESIRDAVLNGYHVITFTSATAGWVVPENLVECHIAMTGGGQSGSGVNGGLHGSFLSSLVDLTGITALDIMPGTAGNLSYARVAATSAHTGAVVVQSPIHGTGGGITNSLGQLTETTSLPGNGGTGGTGGPGGTIATAGQSTPMATGGAPGSRGNFGTSGQPGGSVSGGSKIKCGGAGGGGGGGANVVGNGGGNGGAGGYPGGAGAGRGEGWGGGPGGSVGPGAPGIVWIYWK